MKSTFALEKGKARKSVSIDSDHKRVTSKDEELLDLVSENIDWKRSGTREQIISQLIGILKPEGFRILS